MKLHYFASAICAAMLLASCINDNDDMEKNGRDIRKYICSTANVAAPSIYFTQRLNNQTISFDITDLELTSGEKISFTTPVLTYGFSETEGGFMAQCGSFGIGNGITIDSFKYLSCYNENWVILTISVDGEVYEYNSLRTFGGNTFTTTEADGTTNTYGTSETTYGIILHDVSTADVYIYNARFAEAMPQGMTLMVPNLEMWVNQNYLYQINNNGDVVPFYILNGAKLPFERYTISDFICEINPQGESASLTFVCPAGTVTVQNMRPI